MRALRHETLPETDYVLGMNVGIYKRTKFEPLKEAFMAREKNASTERIAVAAENYARDIEEESIIIESSAGINGDKVLVLSFISLCSISAIRSRMLTS